MLLGFASCDSDSAFVVASALCVATGVLGGGLLFIGRGQRAETFGSLIGAALGALIVAVPLTVLSFVVVLLVAIGHCGLD